MKGTENFCSIHIIIVLSERSKKNSKLSLGASRVLLFFLHFEGFFLEKPTVKY